jgi:uncharacterized protein YkwD
MQRPLSENALRARPTVALLLSLAVSAASCASPSPAPGGSSAPRPTTTRPTTTTPAPAPLNPSVVADEMFTRTNDARRGAGLPVFLRSAILMRAAQTQADQMAQTGVLAHDVPGTAYPTLKSRLEAVQYKMSAAGENIAEGYRGAPEVVSGWMTSPGHRANILSATYTELGTGVARARDGKTYYVQVFGRPPRGTK